MTWVKVDDAAPLHPKLLDVGPEAAWLWLAGLAHCNRAVTDGTIRKAHLGALYPWPRWSAARLRELADLLVSVGLWVDGGDAYTVHDYSEYQAEALRSSVQERRQEAAERKRRQREREKLAKSTASHAVTGRDSHAGQACDSGVTDARDLRVTETPPVTAPRPVPARPVPTGEREPHARPSSDLISAIIEGVSQGYRANQLPPPKECRVLTWKGWHDFATWCVEKAALTQREPLEVAKQAVRSFFRNKRAAERGHPIQFLAQNAAEFWSEAA